MYIIMKYFKVKNKDLGITKHNLIKSLKRNSILIIVLIINIIILKLLGINRYKSDETIWFYIFYIFISCPIQEFLYRGIFGYFEKIFKKKYVFWFLSSFLYSFVHIIYKDYLTCILTFGMGLIWYFLYKKDYNLFGVCISHIVLGILTIFLGIIN